MFCLLLVVQTFCLQKVVEMLEDVIVDRRGQVNTVNEAKLGPQFIQVLKCWLCTAMGKNWAQSLDQRRLQELQFSAHFNNLLSTLLRGNGFTGIQKALEDHTGSRPPDSDQDLFLVQVWLQEMLWSFFLVQPLSWTSPVVVQKSTLRCTSQSNREMVRCC